MSRFRVVAAVVIAASMVGAVWIGTFPFRTSERSVLPIAPVRTGEFVAVIRTRGQIEAQRSFPIYAPLVQDLRIAWMAPASDLVEQGEAMIRFDSSSAERDLIQRRSAMQRARAGLDRAIVDADVAAEHDARDVADARLAVELAELDTADNEFVGGLDAERGRIDLGVARQNLRQLEAEVAQRSVSRESQIASLRRQFEAAEAWVGIVESRIARMEIRAPLSGYAIYSPNRSSLGAALGGAAQQPFRVGDQVAGGINVATIPDLSSLLIDVTVEEIDRGRMHADDEVIVRVDALPDVSIETTLSAISPMAEMSLDSRGRSFHAQAALGDTVDPRIRPGMNASMDIVIERIPDAVIVPAQALFTRGGKPTVHLVEPGGFRAVEVEILARNPDEIAVRGLAGDARVTLVDPFAADGGAEAGAAPEEDE
jgi:multidrug efflux pump subunit AcrA (membrane-fusion protein)